MAAAPKAFGLRDVQFITQYMWDPRVPSELRLVLSFSLYILVAAMANCSRSFSQHVPDIYRSQFGGRKPARGQPPSRKVKVQPIAEDEDHPAAGQFGLFAAQTLSPGEHVLDYIGCVSTEEHTNVDSQYVACLAPGLLCDAEKFGNEVKHSFISVVASQSFT